MTARARVADALAALALVATVALAGRETALRLAGASEGPSRAGVASGLPDADAAGAAATREGADLAVRVRPRDPRLLERAASLRGPEEEGEALRLLVRAAAVAPYAGHLGAATGARLLEEGRARVREAADWRERAARATARRAPGADELVAEARRRASRARWTLETLLEVDRLVAPSAAGRADLTAAATEARALLSDLADGP